MRRIETGKKIKEFRLQLGISQEELAEMAQLSLRTIQRIENNETEPRGDSLKRISKALNMTVVDLTTERTAEESESPLKEDKGIFFLLNFSAFGFLIFPLLGIIFPLIVWFIYKDKIIFVKETGRKIIKFQVIWCVLLFMVYLYIFLAKFLHTGLPILKNDEYVVFFVISLHVLNALVILVNILKRFNIKRAVETNSAVHLLF